MAKAAWGEILETLSEGRSTTIDPRNMTFKPEDLRVNSQSITVGLHRDAARAVARVVLIHNESSVLDEASNLLEEAIAKKWLFPVHIGCNILLVKGDEELPFAAHVDQLKMELTDVSTASESPDCKPTLTIDANHTELHLQQGSDLAREMAKELSTKDPLSALTGLSSETDNRMKPELHSQQLTINLRNLHGEVSQSLTQNSSSHDVHQKLLTQNRHAKVNIQTVSFINEGLPACVFQLNGLNCHIKQDQQKSVTVNASSHSGELDLKSEILPLPTEMSASILNGQASAGYTDLNINLKRPADGAYLETDVTAVSMTAKVKDTLNVGDLKSGASFPNEMTMQASGTLFHCDKDKVFVSPQLQFSGNSNAVIIKDGLPIPFYLKTDAQIKDASYIQFSNKSSFSGNKNTTRVVSGGDYSIKDTIIGPAKINLLNLSMDKNLNGHFKADKASVDLDKTLQIMGKNKPVSWYTKLFLKKKKLACSLETPIYEGNIDLKRLKIKKLKFTPTTRASLLDRIICKALNWFICPILKHYCKLSTKLRPTSKKGKQKNQRNLIPVLSIKVGPFRARFDLPIPTSMIDHHSRRLSIAGALHEYGIQLIRPGYMELITSQLDAIRKGLPDSMEKALTSLLQFSKDALNTPDYSGAVTLMAQQWPLDSIAALLTTKTLPAELMNNLLAIIKLFSSLKETQVTALLLASTLKPQLTADKFQQVISDIPTERINDPLALALHYELTGSLRKAKSAYEELLANIPDHPIAGVRAACLLLAEAERNGDSDIITTAMNYLLKSALNGNESAKMVILAFTNSKDPAVRSYAHLYAAAWYLKTEKNQKDFLKAIDHIESTAQSTDAYQQALQLLECRQHNAQLIVHPPSKERSKGLQARMRSMNTYNSKTHSIPAADAYSLGVRMLYGADGIPYNPNQAMQLLQRASEDGDYENRTRLHLQLCNLVSG
ncbi:tetratricopeptide repeat protein [Endozoicomonas elysicola]|nr:sel1 repeat family protein [Endozoicomonas elysicola]